MGVIAAGDARSSRHSALAPLALAGTAAAFALSGGAALVDQVIWQRVLVLHTGVGVASVAIIVAVFMAGLGLGAELGGALSARLSRRAALLSFAALELGVGACGAASPWVLYDVMYVRFSWLYTSLATGAVLHFAVLILPTLLMGMSLPFLVRATVGDPRTACETIGLLYGANVLGAAAGALATPWLLVPAHGLRGALLLAAGANVTAALLALVVARFAPPLTEGVDEPLAVPVQEPPVPFRLWVALYATTGAVAMALEVVWFRITDLAVKSSPFTFGTVLAVYLFGLGAGSLAGGRLALRVARPLRGFLLCQVGIVAYAAAAVVALGRLPPGTPGYAWYLGYWSRAIGVHPGGPDWSAFDGLRLYVGIPAFLFGIPTVLMGVAFALLQRAVQDDARTSGRKVGILQAANIAGCVVGSLLAGLLLLEHAGSTGALRLLTVAGLGFAALGARRAHGFRLPAVALAILCVALPGQDQLWSRLHGQTETGDLVDEDATGVATLLPIDETSWRLFNNGWSHSSLPFGAHTPLGLVPAIVHPAPVDVAIIGLGSGDTAWAAGCRRETQRITVFEVRAGQRPLLERLAQRTHLPQLTRFLADARVTLRLEDGRRALAAEPTLYDVIEADPLHPYNAGSGLLYSQEFYELCARRLKPGGIICVWTPTGRVTDTLRRVFATTLLFHGQGLLVGSNGPLAPAPAVWLARLADPHVAAYLAPTDVARHEATFQETMTLGPARRRPWTLRAPNLDLYPRDEFLSR